MRAQCTFHGERSKNRRVAGDGDLPDGEARLEPGNVIPLHESETDWQLAEISAPSDDGRCTSLAGYSPEAASATVAVLKPTKTRSAWIAEGSGDIRTAVLTLHPMISQ